MNSNATMTRPIDFDTAQQQFAHAFARPLAATSVPTADAAGRVPAGRAIARGDAVPYYDFAQWLA